MSSKSVEPNIYLNSKGKFSIFYRCLYGGTFDTLELARSELVKFKSDINLQLGSSCKNGPYLYGNKKLERASEDIKKFLSKFR